MYIELVRSTLIMCTESQQMKIESGLASNNVGMVTDKAV